MSDGAVRNFAVPRFFEKHPGFAIIRKLAVTRLWNLRVVRVNSAAAAKCYIAPLERGTGGLVFNAATRARRNADVIYPETVARGYCNACARDVGDRAVTDFDIAAGRDRDEIDLI